MVASPEIKSVPVYVPQNVVVSDGHEPVRRVVMKIMIAPNESTPAVIEPQIAMTKIIEAQGQHNAWKKIVFGRRTVTN